MDDQLKRAAVKGVGWAFFSSTAVRMIQVVTTLVLAKLLMPDDFGVFALAAIAVNALILFRDLGFAQVLIYRQGDVHRTAGTAFTLSLASSLIMAIMLAASAPAVGRLLGSMHVVGPLRVMSLALFVSGAANVPLALLDRDLKFRKRAVPELGGAVANASVAITLAALGFGAWSMVLGWVALEITITALALAVCPWRPKPTYDRDQARTIIDYGKFLMAASLITFAFFNIDKLGVGKWLGERPLGFYSLAFTVCNLPATNLSHVIGRVMFPTYSRLQNDLQDMKSVYLTTIRYISLAAFPAAVGIMILAGPVIRTFYSEKWVPAIPIFHVLAVYGLVRSIGSTASAVFMSTGQPGIVSRTSLLQLAVAVPFVYPAAERFGVTGVALLFTTAYAAGSVFALGRVGRILGISAGSYLAAIALPMGAAGAAGAASLGMVRTGSGVPGIVGSAVAVCAVYGLLVWIFDRSSFRGVLSILARGGAS